MHRFRRDRELNGNGTARHDVSVGVLQRDCELGMKAPPSLNGGAFPYGLTFHISESGKPQAARGAPLGSA